ncbi:hypothetical protein ACQI4L_14045 [Mycolicibacterium litorale]|uniref:hypothetical protein n=1 Tax=Mycolicibacterium litorale TaxID=758802 RepID=UPI003CF76A64
MSFRTDIDAPDVILFAAPAHEIDSWAGVPQRELIDRQETIGFQREENPRRLEQLARFFLDTHNVSQNPLLCAQRSTTKTTFASSDDPSQLVRVGTLEIENGQFDKEPLTELFRALERDLRERQPGLAGAAVSPKRLQELHQRLADDVGHASLPDISAVDIDAMSDDEGISGLFASETHVLEFWQEIKARLDLLDSLDSDTRSQFDGGDDFLGFDRDALAAYLKPVFLVDGQHRLKGALLAAQQLAGEKMGSDAIQQRIEGGEDIESLTQELISSSTRLLPVSLLMNPRVEEHVFQFVVVNQKATPVGKALLGTIVATSLTESELQNVTDRLEQVQINVSDSQAVAWFTRSPESAFYNVVQQGIEKEGGGRLPWTVLRDLVNIFRNLSGARLPHAPGNDYADVWRRKQLTKSDLVASAIANVPDDEKLPLAFATWSQLNGPWREVANAFFNAIRSRLGDASNVAAYNGWGSTQSNLFNKVSLLILVADFFQWLTDTARTISSADDCAKAVDDWLEGTDKAYFNRDWNLSGVKKDTPGIRHNWSELWVDYRKDPSRLTDVRNFRKAKTV